MRNEGKTLDFVSTIPSCYRGLVSHKLDKIVARANKKGMDGMLTYTISDTYVVEERKQSKAVPVKKHVIDVSVKGEVPKIDGWTFVGKLTHDGAGDFVTVLAAPGMTVPTKYRKSTGSCDHCTRSRNRKDTFVVSKNRKFKEIGRSCLKDFFPSVNIEWIVNYFKYVDDMLNSRDFDDFDWDSPKARKLHPKADLGFVLMVSNAVIRRDGWMSATLAKKIMDKAEAEGDDWTYAVPTSSEILHQLRIKLGLSYPSDYEVKNDLIVELSKKDEALAPKVIDFVRNELYDNGHNDYVYNMKNFFSLDEVELRYVPFVASGIAAYNRSIEKAAEKSKKPVSNYVGTVGDKITKDVEVTGSKYVNGYYGSSLLVRMVDDDGNTLTTFYSGHRFEPEVGDKLTITGTIKDHKEFKGWKSTMLTRVKFA